MPVWKSSSEVVKFCIRCKQTEKPTLPFLEEAHNLCLTVREKYQVAYNKARGKRKDELRLALELKDEQIACLLEQINSCCEF